jgi:hypothetical protein
MNVPFFRYLVQGISDLQQSVATLLACVTCIYLKNEFVH